jgi:hypothetical protein
MTPCPCCGREAPLTPKASILDGLARNLCITCANVHAQPVAVVVRAVNATGWKAIPAWKRRMVRVFYDDDYLTVKGWAEIMARQQLASWGTPQALVWSVDEEDRFTNVWNRLKRAQPEHERRRRGSWFLTCLDWLGLLPVWEVAS